MMFLDRIFKVVIKGNHVIFNNNNNNNFSYNNREKYILAELCPLKGLHGNNSRLFIKKLLFISIKR